MRLFSLPHRQRPGEIMHKRGDENRLARTRQSRDAKAQPSAGHEIGEAFGGDPRLEEKIGKLRQVTIPRGDARFLQWLAAASNKRALLPAPSRAPSPMRQTRVMTGRARALRRELTDAERKLWFALRAHRLGGHSFRRQAPCGPFIADFLSAEARLVIEVDGATHSTGDEIAYDKRRDAWFAENGYRVLRLTNDDVYRHFDGVIETILAWIGGRA